MKIDILYQNKPDINSVIRLYIDAGWGNKDNYINTKHVYNEAIKNSNLITAYDGNKLIGIVRFLSDFYHDTQILELIVDKQYQQKGIGKFMLDELKKHVDNTSIYINSTSIAIEFLEKNGFKKNKLTAMFYNKK